QTALPREAVRKAQVLIGGLAQAGHRRVDIVAHSEGALGAVIAAAHYPHRVRNMVLVDPGGMIVNDRWHQLAGRFAAMLAQCVIEAAGNAAERRALVWATINPALYTATHPRRAVAQVEALVRWHSLDLLSRLHEAGVGIVVFEGVDNCIFPMRRAGPFVRDGVPLLDGFYAVRGGHAKLLGDARYAGAILDALDLLRDRQAGSRSSLAPVTTPEPAAH
ncbi:MAG: alpha/beta fold hydrolase, partial [Dehalococcoidia bacterium]